MEPKKSRGRCQAQNVIAEIGRTESYEHYSVCKFLNSFYIHTNNQVVALRT